MPFGLEKSSARKMIYSILAVFSMCLCLKLGKICKNNNQTWFFNFINTYQVPPERFE